MIGKSDPYVVLYVRAMFKVKTKVVDNNLNPVWDQTFEILVEDKETQSLIFEVLDQDIGQDERLGVVKFPLNGLEPGTWKESELRLLPAFDMLKIKDKKDMGTITIELYYQEFSKEEQVAALEEEKRMLEERKKLKEAGLLGSTMDALDGAAGLVGSGVGLVGSGVVGGVGLVDSGVGAGVWLMGCGIGAVGGGLAKAGKFMSRSISGQPSKKSGSSTPMQEKAEKQL